jgi:hypothetical protein
MINMKNEKKETKKHEKSESKQFEKTEDKKVPQRRTNKTMSGMDLLNKAVGIANRKPKGQPGMMKPIKQTK